VTKNYRGIIAPGNIGALHAFGCVRNILYVRSFLDDVAKVRRLSGGSLDGLTAAASGNRP
jgi:hypothetical protein